MKIKIIFSVIVYCCIIYSCREQQGNSYSTLNNQSYKYVKIGKQIWMAENLNASTYNNGDLIPQVQNAAEWSQLTTGAWCYYGNKTKNGKIYGKLYNWYAVQDPRGLAPEGWHIPSDREWAELIKFLGGEDFAGGKLKEAGTKHFHSPNTGATNESGFTALPSGSRSARDGSFNFLGYASPFWTATEANRIFAWNWVMANNRNDTGALELGRDKKGGSAVRCVKD